MSARRLILASGSAARRHMLETAGVSFDAVAADVDEEGLKDDLLARVPHRDVAIALSEAKALAVAEHHPDALVIGSDQILSTGATVLCKPGSREGARQTLRQLRGTTHSLHSGVALAQASRVIWRSAETATLTMRDVPDEELERYLDVAGQSIYGCVGAYQIEGPGIRLFERVEGDHFTIMGMPLLPLLSQLRRLGAMP